MRKTKDTHPLSLDPSVLGSPMPPGLRKALLRMNDRPHLTNSMWGDVSYLQTTGFSTLDKWVPMNVSCSCKIVSNLFTIFSPSFFAPFPSFFSWLTTCNSRTPTAGIAIPGSSESFRGFFSTLFTVPTKDSICSILVLKTLPTCVGWKVFLYGVRLLHNNLMSTEFPCLNWSQRHLPSRPHLPQSPPFPSVCARRDALPIHCLVLWSGVSATCLH